MKKVMFCFIALVAMIASVSVFANSYNNKSTDLHHGCSTHVHMEGKHCRYTVGCSCPGFAPTQHKEVYKQAICRNCGHHRRFH